MFISEQGLNLIKQFEGCILQSYDDYNDRIVNSGDSWRGTLTIGYGHIEGVYAGQKITKQQAEDMLREDMVKYCRQVQEVIDEGTIKFEVNQNMFDALVSFDYNLGQGCVRTLCKNRDKQTVADMMLEYRNKGSQWEAGLLRRRKAEREMFLGTGNVASNEPQISSASSTNIYLELQRELNLQGFTDKNGNKLIEDGIPGALTLSACPVVKKGARGSITTWIQLRCGANPDGIFGTDTENAVKWMQRKWNINDDGIVGPNTWRKLLGL